ncbi:MAG: hypothetical protein IPI73_07590 [Betaproteobacteria bacterium]|nr:hypothetical protein [Betaproteobacteria bacterium]
MERRGFNDRAASVVVERGHAGSLRARALRGKLRRARRGSYDSLSSLGASNNISSVRPVVREPRSVVPAPAPLPAPTYEDLSAPRRTAVRDARHLGACRGRPAATALLGRTPAGRRRSR